MTDRAKKAFGQILDLVRAKSMILTREEYSALLEELICELQTREEALDTEMGRTKMEIPEIVQQYLRSYTRQQMQEYDEDELRDDLWANMSEGERDLANAIVKAVWEEYL